MENKDIENVVGSDDMFNKFKAFIAAGVYAPTGYAQRGSLEPEGTMEQSTKTQPLKKPVLKRTSAKYKIIEALPPPEPDVEPSSDSEIEKQPAKPLKVYDQQVKPKRVLSEKQKEGLQRGRERRDELRRERAEEKTRQEDEYKKVVEQKVVKKAIQIKKKQLKQQKIIEPDSDTDSEVPPPRQRKPTATQARPTQPARPNIVYL